MRHITHITIMLVTMLIYPSYVFSQANFDGPWTVEVITENGRCDKAYRYEINVSNGQVSYGGKGKFQISGKVDINGKVGGTIARAKSDGFSEANFRGRLAISSGSGSWIGTSKGGCSGRWNADRR